MGERDGSIFVPYGGPTGWERGRSDMKRPWALLCLLTCFAAHAATVQIRIHEDRPGPTISRNLYGQFMEHLGRGVYGGVWVGPESPIPNHDGFRTDVLAALKALHIPVIRWPGGCFADEYHWRDGIGPRGERPVTINTNWGGVEETNAFGTHEFLELTEMLGADAYIAGNVGTGSPREMAEWLEYMTSDAGSSLARLRRTNGRDQPWHVAYWGIGNEAWGCGGNMRPEYYADLYRRFAAFLKAPGGTPPQKIASGGHDALTDWTEELSRIDSDIDGISHHYYTLPTGNWDHKGSATEFGEDEWISTLSRTLRIDDYIRRQEDVLDKNDPDGRIGLYIDEWGTWYDPDPAAPSSPLYQQNTLRDAVVAALNFHVFHRHAARVRMANIAQTVNVLQAMILTSDKRIVLTPTYHAFELYVPFQDATYLPLTADGIPQYRYAGYAVPALSATAARGKDGKLHIGLINVDPHTDIDVVITLDDARLSGGTARILTGSRMNSRNTFDVPNAVEPKPFARIGFRAGALNVTLPAKSIVVIETNL